MSNFVRDDLALVESLVVRRSRNGSEADVAAILPVSRASSLGVLGKVAVSANETVLEVQVQSSIVAFAKLSSHGAGILVSSPASVDSPVNILELKLKASGDVVRVQLLQLSQQRFALCQSQSLPQENCTTEIYFLR